MLPDWSTLPTIVCWRQDVTRSLRYNLYAGTRTIGSMI